MPDVLIGGGEMGALMRSLDWAATPIGPVQHWPQSLRTSVSICLNSRFPILVWWGPDLVMLYNDAYRPVLGATKHPAAMGQRGRECWPEIWHIIGPMLEDVLNAGTATWSDDQLLVLDRNGYLEECYFTFSYSPIRDETDGVGGVFCAVTETTQRVLGERRLRTLRDLADQTAQARSVAATCQLALAALAAAFADIPFAALYLYDSSGRYARLVGAVGLPADAPAFPSAIDLAHRSEQLSGGIWSDSPDPALVLPIIVVEHEPPVALLIVGLSPRRALDDDYRGFLNLVAHQIASGLGTARAYEAERQRAEALAEIDQAKTAFFSNVSHEFRTPLTLMLGPLEDTLAQPDRLPAEDRVRLEVAYRNAVRLLKLVNMLLDFSRIEAGRMQASYEPTDLAMFTADLASVFRAATERAGLRLVVICPPLAEPVYIDCEMWEKIVFNLLSNAFKFTFVGEIEVSLQQVDMMVELAIRDTGIGIPAQEIPHLFERFHRVKGARGRTFEGSGIGLALVQELVKLHGGTVRVASEVDQGTTFTVSIPTGTAHLPANRIGAARMPASTGMGSEVYFEEVLRWLPSSDDTETAIGVSVSPFKRARILLADDNTDMREYIQRLLSQEYDVIAVSDGAAALRTARQQPFDLVLSDVMMPHLDGFGLLAALRGDQRTKTLPVIMLSARAGEESRVEGLEAGADDYLIKPFSAKELLARVRTHLALARVRRETEERFRHLADGAPVLIWISDTTKQYTWFNKPWLDFTGRTMEQEYGDGWITGVHAEDVERCIETYSAAFDAREAFSIDYRLRRYDGEYRWVLDNGVPSFAPDDEFIGYIGSCIDITDRRTAEESVLLTNERFRIAEEASNGFVYDWDVVRDIVERSDGFTKVLGYAQGEIMPSSVAWRALIHPEDVARIRTMINAVQAEGIPGSRNEYRVRHKNGQWVWVLDKNAAIYREGKLWRVIGSTVDITERKEAEEALREAQARRLAEEQQHTARAEEASRLKDEFLATVSHELRTPLTAFLGYAQLLQLRKRDEAYVARTVEKMMRSAKAQAQLIEDLLDVSRIISGKLRIEPLPIDLIFVIRSALDTVRSAVEAKGLRLYVDLSPEASTIIGDANRLQQVVWNLLSNAAKFTPPGGVLRVRLELHDRDVQLTVSDTGQGISADFLPYVFDRFRQANSTSNRFHGGLGLGLAIVRHLVELHGGTVRAASAGEGQGATFTVRLPLAFTDDATALARDATAEVDALAACPPELRGLRVLIVDDQPDILDLLHDVLAMGGAVVRVCRAARDALELVRTWKPDVLVSDIAMPGDDGYWLIRNVRSLAPEEGGVVPAIALTAYVRMEDRMRVLAAGFQLYVPKPVEPIVLRSVVARLIQQTAID